MSPAIEVRRLTKRYPREVRGVADVSFRVSPGEICAFLGPNGAGKSTLVHILTTLMLPTEGSVTIAGFDAVRERRKVRSLIGVSMQESALDEHLTGRQHIMLQAMVWGKNRRAAGRRAEELLPLTGLEDSADRPAGTYSGGMRRRLDIALAMVHSPQLLFLDEPTAGLDPESRSLIWQEIRRLNTEERITVCMTTQYLEEADRVAGQVHILHEGTLAASGSPRELKQQMPDKRLYLSFENLQACRIFHDRLAAYDIFAAVSEKEVRLQSGDMKHLLKVCMQEMHDLKLYPLEIRTEEASLDDVFLHILSQKRSGQEV